MTLFTGRALLPAALAGLCLMPAVPTDVHAQKNQGASFIVTVPDVYPAEQGTGFIVRKGPGEKDLIVLNRETLDVSALITAVSVLRQVRKGSPVPAGLSEVTTVQGFAPWRGRTPRKMPALENALERLLKQPRVRIGNVGLGRWLELPDDVR